MSESGQVPPDDALTRLFRVELVDNAKLIGSWLERAVKEESREIPEDVRRAVHSIIGAARIVGAGAVAQLTEAVERRLELCGSPVKERAQAAHDAIKCAHRYLEQLASSPALPDAFVDATLEELKAVHASLDALSPETHRPLPSVTSSRPPPGPPIPEGSLLELFRTEVALCVSVLTQGLVALDTQAPTAAGWEQLMRAAHSVKGAARIVNLAAVAQLAHAFEECLVAAQAGRLSLTSTDIDLLLLAVDSIEAAAVILGERVPEGRKQIEASATAISARLAELAHRPRAQRAPSVLPPIDVEPSLANTSARNEPKTAEGPAPRLSLVPAPGPSALQSNQLRRHDERPATPDATTVREAPQPAQPAAPAPRERVLRVAADSINRLMGLAGESLVESRRVASFAQALQRVKTQHSAVLDLIDSLERALGATPGQSVSELVRDTKNQARDCARILGAHATDLDSYISRSEQLGERLYREALKSRMRPFADATHGFPRIVRDLARQLDKRARLEIAGQATEVDRDALESLDAPINHLVRNALDHGLEPAEERIARGKPEIGTVRIEARHHAGMLLIAVSDDGRGIDLEAIRQKTVERGFAKPEMAATLGRAELLEFLFLPGFSTASTVSEISGRGVGLDVVKSGVEALGGSVRVSSESGRGTAFHLQLPVTRSVVRAVVAEVAGDAYALPLLRIDRIDRVPRDSVKTLENRQYILVDGQPVSLVSARHVLGVAEGARMEEGDLSVVVISDRTHRFGIVVDDFRGEHDLVVRPLDPRLGKLQDIAAAAILMDGSAALILDVDDLIRSIERMIEGNSLAKVDTDAGKATAALRRRILVVDDSITVREAERQLLVNRGYEVDVAVDGVDGLISMRRARYDLVITDIDMPRMNGVDLVKSIKQDPKLSAIPVVIVSYKDRDDDRLRGLEAGANYYLSKSSFHDDKLVEAVEDLIGGAAA